MKTAFSGRLLPVLLAFVALAVTVSVTSASADENHHHSDRVRSNDDGAQAKLSADLQQKVDDKATDKVTVVVSVQSSDVAQASQIMDDTHVASENGAALVVGTVNATKLSKLAGLKGVVSVSSVQFKQTGTPTGDDPEVGNQHDRRTRNEALRAFQRTSVPFDKAPPLRTSNFDQLKSMNVLDAKTHNFTGAWKAGYTGTGVTASVLDGGTDWGHPDLVGTWQTWTPDDVTRRRADAGWVGWPKAFDPYGTLVLALAPQLVGQGLTWYTKTQTATCTYVKKNGKPADRNDRNALCAVSFATQTGPARNFSVAPGTSTHTYTFPASWTKSGTVKLGSHPDEYLLQLYGERPAVLVTDPNTAGSYDTVYVDLSDDYDFSDEKPVTKSSPVSYRDLNGDGYTDLSGGLLYFISDGQTRIPGGPTNFGLNARPGAGDFLAWSGDFDPGIEGHGTLTASNVVGQGVINGKTPTFADIRTPRNDGQDGRDGKNSQRGDDRRGNDDGGVIPGMVIGGAPNAKLAPMGDIYFSFGFSKQFGYFLTNRWGIQVTSNSYGSSDLNNDGMDAASAEADFLHGLFGNATTPLFSTGNGGPGFGTVTAPSPTGGIQVGASTSFGSTGWDSIANYSQVNDNDVIEWSNRGPGANGRNGVDVVADGSYAPGDATLNTVIDGRNAWTTWGGTSRSTPVAVGETALIYQAYKAAHGAFPAEPTVKTILKSSANDLGYDTFTQGAGSIDAGKAVSAAAGTGAIVSPDEWRPHTDGNEDPAFPQTIAPGDSAAQSFSLSGPGTWAVSDRMLKQYASEPLTFKSASLSQESTFNFNAPDYLINITNNIKAHPDADLVVIRATYPHEQFDGNGDYRSDQSWRLFAYNWTDINHDRKLWTDVNGNGVVNHTDKSTSSNIDGFNDIDFRRSEMQQGEYERFFYHRPGSNVLMGFVRNPAQRMGDGMFIGFQHSKANPAIDRTDFRIEIDYYKNVDWPWVTETQPTAGGFSATINVPSNAPYGMYEGSVVASNGSTKMVVPVAVTVGATAAQAADGSITSALTFGGTDVAKAQADQLYNNGSIFGANDWTWREESGDWRFYYFNVANPVPDGTLFLTDTKWDDPTVTDLDTLLFGPAVLPFDEQLFVGGAFDSIDTVGGSQNAYLGSGTWGFNTSTGGPEEIVAAPASQGTHAVVQHGVGFNGDKFNVPFTTTLGSLAVNPTSVTADAAADGTGSFNVVVNSSLALAGLKADAFGLSQPQTSTVHAKQDDPTEADPSTASAKVQNIVIGDHASRATFTLPQVNDGEDIDLFVARKGSDGNFHVVGASTGPQGAAEEVTLIAPPAGDYEVWVYGFAVSAADSAAGNPVGVDIVQGRDLTVAGAPTGVVPANTPITLHVSFTHAVTSGDPYEAELLLGPDVAPTAVTVPITINGAPAPVAPVSAPGGGTSSAKK